MGVRNDAVVTAYNKGYRITENGNVISPRGKILNCSNDRGGYSTITVRHIDGKAYKIRCHRLAAYIKFGEDAFKEGLVVRHKDDDTKNFRLDNLELGTQEQNMKDKRNKIFKNNEPLPF